MVDLPGGLCAELFQLAIYSLNAKLSSLAVRFTV